MTDHSTPAAFVEIDGNPAPPNLAARLVTTRDGVELRCAISRPNGQVRGTVLILQGRNETIEKYFETMADLNARGFMTACFDWRGQGASAAKRPRKADPDRKPTSPDEGRRLGHVRSMRSYRDDLDAVIVSLLLPDTRPPYSVLAHSMGGLVALSASETLSSRIERLVLSAPLVALPDGPVPAGLLRTVTQILRLAGFGRVPIKRMVLPGDVGTAASDVLTSDERRFQRNLALARSYPGLFLGAPTFGWVASMTRAMKRLERSQIIARITIPTLFVLAGSDSVVSTRGAERLARRMKTGSSLRLPGARHEILQERDSYREPFLAALETFLEGAMPAIAEDRADTGEPPAHSKGDRNDPSADMPGAAPPRPAGEPGDAMPDTATHGAGRA